MQENYCNCKIVYLYGALSLRYGFLKTASKMFPEFKVEAQTKKENNQVFQTRLYYSASCTKNSIINPNYR
jgi:hypothetical protein